MQPDTDPVLTDPLRCPRAICTIPKDNTAAARVTKAPTYSDSEEAKPMALSLEGWGGSYSDTGKEGARDDSVSHGYSKGEGCI
ncbi:hypothetical protein PBY51_007761 [Eleginops maclovinus]|nr:hypothetical protein PBY51_007761 [Eleginops maclovinus]